jgi:hypothetical protein
MGEGGSAVGGRDVDDGRGHGGGLLEAEEVRLKPDPQMQ